MKELKGHSNGGHGTMKFSTAHDAAFWGAAWCGPQEMLSGEEYVIARFQPTHEDGHYAEVRCKARPACFYRIVSEGAGIDLETGSDMSRLARQVAEAIAGGMMVARQGK